MTDHELVNLGKLWKAKLARNLAARQEALATMREMHPGVWAGKLGGRRRGYSITGNRLQVEKAIHAHYSDKAFAFTLELVARRKARAELAK